MTSALATAEALQLQQTDVVFGVNTLFNVFGLAPGVLGTLAAGATLLLQEDMTPADVLEVVERESVTVYHGVPTSFILELNEPRTGGGEWPVRSGIVAGAPVP